MIHIVGLGGIGFWCAASLTRMVSVENITCWDDDTLAGGNGSQRLPYGMDTTKKTGLLQGFVLMVLGGSQPPACIERRFSGLLNVNQGDLVVDCTDMAIEARRRMWTCARNRGAKLIRISYDGQGSIIIASTGLPLASPTSQGGYAAVPSLGLSLAAGGIGAEIVKRYIENPVESFTLHIPIQEIMYVHTTSS